MSHPTFSSSLVIARPAEFLYDLVADVTNMGRWSPICRECWWEDGGGPHVGAWFGGRNVTSERTWETTSQVEVATRGEEFAWLVGGKYVRWSFRFAALESGTEVTESWEFLPAGLARFHERYGEHAGREIARRTADAQKSIPSTLQALKAAAESA